MLPHPSTLPTVKSQFNSGLELSWDLSICTRIYFSGTAGKVNTGTIITALSSLNLIFTSFFSPVCSAMSWSNTAPYSSWIFCISLMWLATLFIVLMATGRETGDEQKGILTLREEGRGVGSRAEVNQRRAGLSPYHQGDNVPHCPRQ